MNISSTPFAQQYIRKMDYPRAKQVQWIQVFDDSDHTSSECLKEGSNGIKLVEQLVKNLGISEVAAKGGSGLLLRMAKGKLGASDFGKVANIIPGIDDLMKSAPETGGVLGGIGKLASGIGGGAAQLGDLAGLVGGFSKLGLDSSMIGKFIPIILAFAQSKGGDAVKSLLEKALR